MGNLEKYINDDSLDSIDPLIKMAIIHYQFESIHPFLDGNGRTWRIIMILYLENLSYEEIAEVTGISSNYIGVKINRIKKLLTKKFKELA